MIMRLGILLIISAALLSVAAVHSAQAQSGMSINVTTGNGYDITISGVTTKTEDISAKITNSATSTLIYVGQQKPNSDGTYSFYSTTGAQGWPEDGIYVVAVKQKESAAYNLSVNIKVENGAIVTENATKSSLDIVREPIVNEPTNVGLTIDVTADRGSDTIIIDGVTTSQANAVTVIVTSPIGNKVHTDQVIPSSSGRFSTEISLGCPHWEEEGVYNISVQQGSNNLFKQSADVEISECLVVPEFGSIALVILVASIVAIIALSTRTRASIMPRY